MTEEAEFPKPKIILEEIFAKYSEPEAKNIADSQHNNFKYGKPSIGDLEEYIEANYDNARFKQQHDLVKLNDPTLKEVDRKFYRDSLDDDIERALKYGGILLGGKDARAEFCRSSADLYRDIPGREVDPDPVGNNMVRMVENWERLAEELDREN